MADARLTAVYAACQKVGKVVTLRRISGATTTDCSVKAVVRGYTADELVGGIQQGDKKVIMTETEVNAASWPLPIKVQDRIIIDSKTHSVQAIDLRHIGEDTAMYVIQVRG